MKLIQKKTLAVFVLGATLAAWAQNNPPSDCVTHTSDCCGDSSVRDNGALTFSYAITCVGGGVTPPTATNTAFWPALKCDYYTDSCTGTNWIVYSDVPVNPGDLYWDPPIPAAFTNCGSYVFYGKIDGVSTDPLCNGHCAFCTAQVGAFMVQAVAITAIVDTYGTPISSANSNDVVIVGQPINLGAQTCGTFSNFQWTVAASTFSDYIADDSTGRVVTYFPLTNFSVSFYWKDAGSKQVSVSADCGTCTSSTNVTFTVVRPTAQITTVMGNVAVDPNYGFSGGYWLHFGDNVVIPGAAGILFSNTIVMPSGYYNGGNTNFSVEWVQLVNTFVRQFQTNNATGVWYQSGPPLSNSVLDMYYPYPPGSAFWPYPAGSSQTIDAPASQLVNSTNAPYKSVSATDGFTMWLMFQPSGGQWVPLRTVDWGWSGTAVLTNTPDTNGNYWVLTGSDHSPSPSPADSTTHPEWTDNVQNHKTRMPQ